MRGCSHRAIATTISTPIQPISCDKEFTVTIAPCKNAIMADALPTFAFASAFQKHVKFLFASSKRKTLGMDTNTCKIKNVSTDVTSECTFKLGLR